MRLSPIYLILTIALSVYCANKVYYGNWKPDYETLSAKAKMSYLWGEITKNATPGTFPSILGLMKLAGPKALGGLDFWVTGQHISDQVPEGRFKGIHSVGMVAKGKFNWDVAAVKKLGLTGGFTEQNDNCIIRASSAMDPNMKNVPNMAIKVLRDGIPSGNFMLGHGLKGTKEPSFFFFPLANHVPNRYGNISKDGAEAAFVNLVFTKGPDMHGIVGLSEFGQYTQDGKAADQIKVPFTIVFQAREDIKTKCAKVPLQGQNYGCLDTLPSGSKLFNMYVIMNPILAKDMTQKDVISIGTFELASKFVSSKFGDEQLWFKHTYWPKEMKLLKSTPAGPIWEAKVNAKFMDTEGPEAYRKFLNATRRRMQKTSVKY